MLRLIFQRKIFITSTVCCLLSTTHYLFFPTSATAHGIYNLDESIPTSTLAPITTYDSSTDTLRFSVGQSLYRWLKQRQQERQLLILEVKIKQLETESIQVIDTLTKILQSSEQSLSRIVNHPGDKITEIRHAYPMGEWNPNVNENTFTFPDFTQLYHYRLQYLRARMTVLHIVQEVLESIGLESVNLVFQNAQIPSVLDLIEHPSKLQEYSKFIIEILEQLGFRIESPPQ